jgi:hypothetical protein
MTSTQTLYDVLFAVVLMVGVAAVLAFALTAAGAMFERAQVRAGKAGPDGTTTTQPSQTEEVRELVRR